MQNPSETNPEQMMRAVDQYASTPASELSGHQLSELLEAAARRGAIGALKQIGLEDADAPADIREIRDYLRATKRGKKFALTLWAGWIKQIWIAAKYLLKWAIAIWLINHLIESDVGKRLAARAFDIEPIH